MNNENKDIKLLLVDDLSENLEVLGSILRNEGFLKKITKDPNEEKRVLIIAHGITNRVILSYYLKIKLKNLRKVRYKN